MSHRYVSTVLFALLGILAGCASAPQELSTTQPPAPRANITTNRIDINSEFESAITLMKSGNWERAQEMLEEITSFDPGLSGAWTNLGIARARLGNTKDAETAFRKAIETSDSQVVAYNELGILCRRTGRLEEAAAIYNKGLEINPNNEDIHWNLAILYDVFLPDTTLALQHFERYQQLTGSDNKQLLSWIDELREKSRQVSVATGAK